MSLDVPTALLERAEQGEVTDAEFVSCVCDSLPCAWSVISGVVADPRDGGGLERHFGVKPAFQNCHRVAAFPLSAVDDDRYQSPEPCDC
ncbi:MAG TPA: hypothetical protein VFX16_09850 [Pseudonocardiaceae bacterium]|nr:hypothetical protein [Pseudonocardiaceae bacterium]